MRRILLRAVSLLMILASAAWAYRENYATRDAVRYERRLIASVKALEQSVKLQHVEWAFLNRPERLIALAEANFDRLMLIPMQPAQFANVASIPEPPPYGPILPEGYVIAPTKKR